MTNREKVTKEFIAKLDDEYLLDEFCRYHECNNCFLRGTLLGCKDGFKEWLDAEYKEET